MATTLRSDFDEPSIFTGEPSVRLIEPKSTSKRKKKRIRPSKFNHRQKLEHQLRRTACSEAWVDAQIGLTCFYDERGQMVSAHFVMPGIYPPKADTTPMRQCKRCRRWTPPVAMMRNGVCFDCRIAQPKNYRLNDAWGQSPSAAAIERLRVLGAKLSDF